MKKEMIISVLVGLIFGLIIVYGVYTARISLNKSNNPIEILNTTPTPASLENLNQRLIINNPPDEQIVDQANLIVAGTTDPHSYIVIFINNNEHLTQADETGDFSIEAQLETGSNLIAVYALDEDGQLTIEERTIIYTTKPLTETLEPTATSAASNGNN